MMKPTKKLETAYNKYGIAINKKLVDPAYKFLSSNKFFWALMVWFIIQAVYMALATKFRIPPDEFVHFSHILLYARESFSPFIHDQSNFYFLGDVTRHAGYLYHYILSFPYRLIQGFEQQTVVTILRFINVGFAVWTVFLVKKIGEQLKLTGVVTNLSILMLTNTMMFVFLSASINYQNLIIPISLLSVYLFNKFVKTLSMRVLLYLLTVLLVGGLIKFTFLPVILVLGLFLAFEVFINRKKILKSIKGINLAKQPLLIVSVLVFAVAAGLFMERYGVNYLVFDDIRPKCGQVHYVEKCKQSALFVRGESWGEVDRNRLMSPRQFVPEWIDSMRQRTFGITAHRSLPSSYTAALGSIVLSIFMVFALVRKYEFKESRLLNYILILSIFYILVLLVTNYIGYLKHGTFGIALQGRYSFPVLPLIYLLGNYYAYRLLSKKYIVTAYAFIVLVLFIPSALPHYVKETGPEWRGIETMDEINSTLQRFMR